MFARAATAGFRARHSSGFIFRAIRPSPQRTYAEDRKPSVARTNLTKSAPSQHMSANSTPLQSRVSSQPADAGVTASATIKNSGKSNAGTADYSNRQEEFRTVSRPEKNKSPQPSNGSTEPNTAKSETAPFSPAPSEDIGIASTTTGSAAPENPPTETPGGTPLPDLTQGIPSSLDFNDPTLTGGTGTRGASAENASGFMGVSPIGVGAGKGGGDLPKSAYISSIDRRRNRIANYAFATLLLLAVTGTVFLGRNWESEEEEKKHPEAPSGWGLRLFYNRVKARLQDRLGYYTEPAFPKLLPDVDPAFERPFTLVLSLDDLLVHSEWSREHGWRIAKRPGVDYFLRYLQQYYELVIFTSAPVITAEQIVRKLDPYRIVMWPLFREATKYVDGKHVKDLSYLNRDLSKVILIDTDPSHAMLQPENAIILPKWKGDPNDRELVNLIPFLEYVATMGLTDTRTVLKSFEGKHIPTEFAAREAVARKKFEEEMANERARRSHRIGKGLLTAVLGSRGGVGPDGLEQTAAEAIEQGKMLQDHIRERGQKQYEALEKEIRENGEKWLKEMAAEDEKFREEQMKGMRSSLAGFIGGVGQKKSDNN